MSKYTGKLRWYTLAADILAFVNANTTSRFGRVSLVPGLIAWDGCDCGAVYIMVNQTYDCEDFPMQKVTADISDGCGAPYEASELVIQVMECAPAPQGGSNSTSVADEDAAARLVRQDAAEVRNAVRKFLCAARGNDDVENFILDAQIVQGPSGNCVGTELRFRVSLMLEVF